ncbi:MAG: pyrroline-5-carboxylate reductase [Hyphomonadaceae bacterium]
MARRGGGGGLHAVLFGAGRMGAAMAAGWLRAPDVAGLSRLSVIEPDPSGFAAIASASKIVSLNPQTASVADVVVLAVKPQIFGDVEASVRPWIGPETLVMSIMAGLPTQRLVSGLATEKVVRAMPNTPGAIGKGVTGYAMSAACGEGESSVAARLLSPLGKVVGPLKEAQMDAVTAISGSGPAYVFLLAECLESSAKMMGLDAETAALLARETVAGAGALLAEGGDPSILRKAVTSPGGTTAAALDVLMAPDAMPLLVRRAVEAAARRSAELSK